MKALVNTRLIGKEFKRVAQIINKSTVMPILENVKLVFEKGQVTVIATDLETTLVSKIPCECKDSFILIVNFQKISDICDKMSDQPITIQETETAITIIGDNDKFKLAKGGKDSEFPKIPDEEFLFSVDVDTDFFTALFSADSCKNPDNFQVRTNSACLDFKKDRLSVVGTNSIALYKKDLKIKSGKLSQSLPSAKFVSAVKGFQNGKLSIAERFAKVELNGVSIITRLQDNKYCNYESILPEEIEYNVKVGRKDLVYAIMRASTTADDTTRLCVLNFESDKIKITSQDVDFGNEGESNIRAIHSVVITAIGVSAKQFLLLLNILDSEEIEMSVTSPTRAIYIKQQDDDSTLCLLMPLMID